jgi:sec-independent protein translocase protein TatA
MILFKLLLFNLGGSEIFIILLVVLLFFGAKRIPELAKGLGKGMREFKDAMSGIENEVKNAASDTPPPPKPRNEITEKIPDTFHNAEGTAEREKSE